MVYVQGWQGSARSPSPKPKSDSAAADFTKVRFSGPEVQVQFRVGLRSPSPSSSPIRVGPRSPSPSPSPIRELTSKSKSNHKPGRCHRIRSTSPSPSPIRLGLRSPQVQPKVRLGAAQPKGGFWVCHILHTMIYMCCNWHQHCSLQLNLQALHLVVTIVL